MVTAPTCRSTELGLQVYLAFNLAASPVPWSIASIMAWISDEIKAASKLRGVATIPPLTAAAGKTCQKALRLPGSRELLTGYISCDILDFVDYISLQGIERRLPVLN